MTRADATERARAAVRQAMAEGMAYTYDNLYGPGLTLYAAVVEGDPPAVALARWREGRGHD